MSALFLTRPELTRMANRIRGRTAKALIENGRDLLKAKDILPRGEFLAWLEQAVQMKPRTAQRCMNAAEWVDTLPKAQCVTVTHLPPREIYLMSAPSTPEIAREQVIVTLGAGKPVSFDHMRQLVNDARFAELPEDDEIEQEVFDEERRDADVSIPTEPMDDDQPKPRKPTAPGVDLGRDRADDALDQVVDDEEDAAEEIDYIPPKRAKRKGRATRWEEAASTAIEALTVLQEIQQEFQDWRDNLPENLESSPVAEKLDEVCEIDIASALEAVNEAEGADLPLGFGRD